MKSSWVANDQEEKSESSHFPLSYLTQEPRYSVRVIIFSMPVKKKNETQLNKTFSVSCVSTQNVHGQKDFLFYYGHNFLINIIFQMIKNKSRSHQFTYHHHSAVPLHSTDLPTFPLCPPMSILTIGRWHISSTTLVSSCLGPCTASCCSLNQDQNSLCGLECPTQSGPPPLHTPPASLSLFPSPWHPLFSHHPSCSVLPQSLCICHAGLCLEPTLGPLSH